MSNSRTDGDVRSALYDRSGMNFFVCEIEGEWRGGWFRIDGGKLEVSSGHSTRTVERGNPDAMTELLRKVLAEIVHESPEHVVAEQRHDQKIMSAFLHSGRSVFIVPGDSAKERER